MIFMSWLKDEIGLGILNGLRTLLASIMATIYEMIGKMYGLFLDLATVDLLSSDVINGIYTRVGLLLGLFMLFKLLFSFLQMMVSPDLITDKQRGIGNIVLRVIVVVVLLGSTPAIFQAALKFQNLLLNNSVVEKLILQEVPTAELAQGKGNYLSWNIFNTFYYIEDPENNCEADEDLKYFENEVYKYGTYNLIRNCLYETYDGTYEDAEGNQYGEESVIHVVHLDGWTAIAVGIFVLWILLMYCISLGVRIAQLAFLQLIAPIPIISYLMPTKNNNLQIWFKQCLTTYLDVFIRIAIMSFVMLVIRLIFHDSVLEGYSAWVVLFIILGLLMFAKKAPELLKELFPSSGAASISKGFKAGNALSSLGAGAVGGAVGFLGGRGAAGRLTGALRGASSGAYNGMKSGKFGSSVSNAFKDQRKRNLENYSKYDPTLTNKERAEQEISKLKNNALQAFGFENEVAKQEREVKGLKKEKEALDRQKAALDSIKEGRDNIGKVAKEAIGKGDYKSKQSIAWETSQQQLDYHKSVEGREAFMKENLSKAKEKVYAEYSAKIEAAGNDTAKLQAIEDEYLQRSQEYVNKHLIEMYSDTQHTLTQNASNAEKAMIIQFIDDCKAGNVGESDVKKVNAEIELAQVHINNFNETVSEDMKIDVSNLSEMSGEDFNNFVKKDVGEMVSKNANESAKASHALSEAEKKLEKTKKKLGQ